jgi:hypothetical protein
MSNCVLCSGTGIRRGGADQHFSETDRISAGLIHSVLLKDRGTGVAELVALSRATLSNIWRNIKLALGLKSVFLITTLFGATPPLDGHSCGHGRHGARYGQFAAVAALQAEGIATYGRSEGQLACRPSPLDQPLFDGASVPFGSGLIESIM